MNENKNEEIKIETEEKKEEKMLLQISEETVKRGARSFMKFDKMITPKLIQFLFYVLSVIAIITGFSMMMMGMRSYYMGGIQVFLGFITMILGPLVVRIQCELLIVIFKIHETLEDIKEK